MAKANSRLGAVPASRFSVGFGSNRSTWLGPPFMKRWITDFAFAGKCGERALRSNEAAWAPRAVSKLVDEAELGGVQNSVAEVGDRHPLRGSRTGRVVVIGIQTGRPALLKILNRGHAGGHFVLRWEPRIGPQVDVFNDLGAVAIGIV